MGSVKTSNSEETGLTLDTNTGQEHCQGVIMDSESVPYWKDYQTNVTRGLVAAAICAVIFILLFVAERFLQKRYRSDSRNIASFNRETGKVTMRGLDNMGMSKDQ